MATKTSKKAVRKSAGKSVRANRYQPVDNWKEVK